jgi:hypothetical protein
MIIEPIVAKQTMVARPSAALFGSWLGAVDDFEGSYLILI